MDASTPSSPQFASGPGRGQTTPAATPSKRCLPYDLTSPMNRDGAAGCCAEPRARSPPYAPPGPRNPQPKPSLRYLEPRTLEPRGRPAHTLHHRHAPTRHPAVHPAARAAADRVQLQTARAPSPPTAARLRSPSPTHSREVRSALTASAVLGCYQQPRTQTHRVAVVVGVSQSSPSSARSLKQQLHCLAGADFLTRSHH